MLKLPICIIISSLVQNVFNSEVASFSWDQIMFEYQGMTIIEREFEGIKLFKMLAGSESIYYVQSNETDMSFHLHYNQFNFFLKKLTDAVLIRDVNDFHQIRYVEANITEISTNGTGEAQYSITYDEVTKEVQATDYDDETKSKGFWMIKDYNLIFVSEFSSDGYYSEDGSFCQCKVYETKYSEKPGYFLECKNSPNKIVALAKDDDDDGGKPAFFIVINGQKIKTNDITESKGGLIVNLSKTSMIVEIIPGNYFSQIGYWLLMDGVYVFATKSPTKSDHTILINGQTIPIDINYSISSKKEPSTFKRFTIENFSTYLTSFFGNSEEIQISDYQNYFIHEGNSIVQLVPIELMKGEEIVQAKVCIIQLADKVYGLLVFVDNKQYIIVKSKEGDADVVTIYVDEKPISFVHSAEYGTINGVLIIDGDVTYFNKITVTSQNYNGIEGYWIENNAGVAKFVNQIPDMVSGGFWAYFEGIKLYVIQHDDIANGIYVKGKIMMAKIIPILIHVNQFKLSTITHFAVIVNDKLNTVQVVQPPESEMEIIHDDIKYYVASREPFTNVTIINIGRKYLTGTYKEASVGNIIGYWFENADGPMFLIPANKHDDNAIKGYINGKETVVKIYKTHSTGMWIINDNKVTFSPIDISSSKKYGLDGYLINMNGMQKFYFETDSSIKTGIWIEVDGEKKYVVNDLFFLSDAVYIIFYITHNNQRYPVYTNRKTKEFWIYMDGVKYFLQMKDDNFSEDINIMKNGAKYLLLKKSKVCSCDD